MKEKMSEHHHIFFSQSFLDEFAVCLRHFKQQFQGFNPALSISCFPAATLPSPKMQAHLTNQFFSVAVGYDFFKILQRHK